MSKIKTFKLKQKDQYTWHIKEGRKIKYKIFKSSLGYHVAQRTADTLEIAIQIVKDCEASFLDAFINDKYTIEIL